MILVSRPFHQRRAYDTFRQQHPDTEYINCPSDEPLDTNDPVSNLRIVQEVERLFKYSKRKEIGRQDIANLKIPYEVLKASAIVRR